MGGWAGLADFLDGPTGLVTRLSSRAGLAGRHRVRPGLSNLPAAILTRPVRLSTKRSKRPIAQATPKRLGYPRPVNQTMSDENGPRRSHSIGWHRFEIVRDPRRGG